MRRIVLWCSSTVAALVLLFSYHTSLGGSTPTETAAAYSGTLAGSSSTPSATAPEATNDASSGSGSTKTTSATRTTTGSLVATRYGPVQVQVETSGSTITKVSVLQYPDSDPRDAQINGYAVPILVQETLDAQGSGIDMVSGATYTSDGYVQSLQSALDRAGL